MRKNVKTLTLAALVLLAACSKDDDSNTGNQNDQATEELENTLLQANDVANNVMIQGGTKNEGMPPTPNEAISLDVSSSSKIAYLNEGFEIDINSDGNVVGAYLQFTTNDDNKTLSDSYYDIDLSSNANKSELQSLLKNKKSSGLTAKEDEQTLDVDFNTQIEPGTFCYVICVYDGEGNISAPQEVCVTVEAWGGNSALVGEWELEKEEYPAEDGGVEVDVVGTPECVANTATCANEMILEFEECGLLEFANITFKEDGTYEYEYKGGENYLDYNASIENCEASYQEYVFHFTSAGNWAYVADEQRLTLVAYTYDDIGTEGQGEEIYLPGEGLLLFDGPIDLNGNSLVITEAFDGDGDGTFEEVFKAFFERK